ncbi:ABC-2 type transport system ATP-binding protein [Clostridium amylolyticum]|uniref:ABC-2 type transport system ATP-binding protein n=1 Tax=Clostridium amylolyticum TaxID=1121298 RepID=A0A1M6LFN9_9CLOT|nr:ABC transporter ATP-binding protein [Clostridium amylolyticum]SHJ69875.1 ABC-2 type transport system ATP-binding protein [Clostridium amylolyticum]
MIEIKGFSKNFDDKRVLNNINISVPKGSIFGLIGPNGAGKTTLIKALTGIYYGDKGEIFIDGQNVYENVDIKSKIGYVADENNFLSSYRVKDIIKFYQYSYKEFNLERFRELNKIFKLPQKSYVFRFSKGMKMRLSIMLNLCIMPEVLILDEPTSGLDPVIKRKFMNLLLDEVAERQTTVFISSHNLSDLERICDGVAIINQGEVKYSNSIENMKNKIKKLQVAFIADAPEDIDKWEEIIKVNKVGRVYHLITKDYNEELMDKLKKLRVHFIEELDLSLEDMFLYTLGEEDYYEEVL